MQIIKKRLKNILNNKILQGELTSYNIFYILLDSSGTITKSFKKKTLTKLLFLKNFTFLKKSAFIYPIYYLGSKNITQLVEVYNKLNAHIDFNKILICNIQVKNLVFQTYKLFKDYNLGNPLFNFFKCYFLLNIFLLNFIFIKRLK